MNNNRDTVSAFAKQQRSIGRTLTHDNGLLDGLQNDVIVIAGLMHRAMSSVIEKKTCCSLCHTCNLYTCIQYTRNFVSEWTLNCWAQGKRLKWCMQCAPTRRNQE